MSKVVSNGNIKENKQMTGKIKQCTVADLKQLQAISRTTFTDTYGAVNTPADLEEYLEEAYNDDQLLAELRQPTTQFDFIYVENALAGYLKLNWGPTQSEHYGDDLLEIERIYILPAFKRQGLGQQFYQHAIATAQKLGKQAVWLGVWEHNPAAQKFYQQMGFEQIGDHRFQLGSDPQRDLILRKTLV
ncbi:GNAT family N-acetyltransferase [Levilactobacillus yonginensis]|uniref:GNAT family N-acetyltransferase n=1 Tax=Levilactobacillus yonginensis TaxID=1054041 RepID=UPI001CDC46B4|nr:GNAT family N-acetyltransferase [Levilactobacillus yonginensis]